VRSAGSSRRPPVAAAAEGAVTAVVAGALAASVGTLIGLTWPAAVVGGLNGAVSGARGTYAWKRPSGWLAALLDSTWSLPMTAVALVAHAAAFVSPGRGRFVAALSRRLNRHVYAGGFRLRPRFVITLGNTINRAGDNIATSDRRQRLVTDHEDVHVWQARWFGVLYPLLYVGWSVLGALVGVVVWATRRRADSLAQVIEACSYYLNPFEWWAYSRDGFWPPRRLVGEIGWRRPAVRAFSATTRAQGRGRAASPPVRR